MSDDAQRCYDALLIVRYQTGDDAALDELVGRHESRVRAGVVRALGGCAPAVDDLCQQVWVAVVKGLARLNQPMAFEAWLSRIVRAEVALFLRRRERRRVPIDTIRDPEDRPASMADGRMGHGQTVKVADEPVEPDRLAAAIQSLGQPYASMLRMRYWQSWSYQQIADTLEIPVGTVRSRLHWARRQLAKLLSREENPP